MGLITVDLRDRKQLYEQLVDNIKNLILVGDLAPDEKLPSVRSLARELGINPNTIQKAYAELERQGVIYSLKGRGSFVGSSLQELRTVQQKELLEQLAALSTDLYRLQVPQDEVCAVVQQVYEQQKEDEIHD